MAPLLILKHTKILGLKTMFDFPGVEEFRATKHIGTRGHDKSCSYFPTRFLNNFVMFSSVILCALCKCTRHMERINLFLLFASSFWFDLFTAQAHT